MTLEDNVAKENTGHKSSRRKFIAGAVATGLSILIGGIAYNQYGSGSGTTTTEKSSSTTTKKPSTTTSTAARELTLLEKLDASIATLPASVQPEAYRLRDGVLSGDGLTKENYNSMLYVINHPSFIQYSGNKDVTNNFSLRNYDNLQKLLKHVPNISKYPKDLREGAIHIDDIIHKNNLINSQNEEAVWTSFLGPAVSHIISGMDNGEVSYELDISDKDLESMTRGQRLLPVELLHFNIVTGEYSDNLNLDLGKYNVSPDQNLGGKSPQEWLKEEVRKAYATKTIVGDADDPAFKLAEEGRNYELAIQLAKDNHPAFSWPESDKAWLKSIDIVLQEDDVPVYIIGISRTLIGGKNSSLRGADTDNYASLISRAMGRASFSVINGYPDISGIHGEPYIPVSSKTHEKLINLGKEEGYGDITFPHMFGYWQFLQPLQKDHEGKRPMNLRFQ